MYDAILIDDESKLLEVLKIKINKFCPEIKILDTAANVSKAYEKIMLLKPKLIFLDIAMPGESGFDLLQKFDTIDFEIIFVTGFNEFALDALKVSAVDYVLKPIQTESLISAVSKAKERIDNRSKIAKYEILKHNLNHIGDQATKVAIPGANSYEFVKIADIIRCEGWQKYTKIILSNGSVIVSSYNIGVFRDMLDNYDFFSTHKSHLINNNHISKYTKDGTLQLSDGSTVPVARRRKDEFMATVVKYISLF
ncbi:MAG: LytTR family DNA-binding domain-containing protein [Saprospiraceae bacterium]